MASILLYLNSVIESSDKYNGKKVSDIVEKKGCIFQMIKKGYRFDEEVLEKAHITRSVRNHKTELVISDHEKETKKYKKDTATYNDIIKEINTLEYDGYVEKEDEKENKEPETEYDETRIDEIEGK